MNRQLSANGPYVICFVRRKFRPTGRKERPAARQKGTPNERTSVAEWVLEEMSAGQIGHVARVMMDKNGDACLRFDAAKELAQYIAPNAIPRDHRQEAHSLPRMSQLCVFSSRKR